MIHVGILSYEGPLWTYAHRAFVDKEKTAGGAVRRAARGAREAGDVVGVVAAVEVRMNAADRWHPADVILLTGAWSFLPPPDSTLAAQMRVVADAAARGERGAVLTMGSRGLPSVMVRAVDDSGNMGDVFDVRQRRKRGGRDVDTRVEKDIARDGRRDSGQGSGRV